MKEEQLYAVVEAAIKDSEGMEIWQVVMLVMASAVAAFCGSFFKEKAKSSVTKQDIEEITRKIEGVKLELGKSKEIESIKYNLRYDACLLSLNLVDASLSHILTADNGAVIVKQHASTKEARECHSKLILSCVNIDLIDKFHDVMFGQKASDEAKVPPLDVLNEYRNLIRKELGFGEELEFDRERVWFGKLNCELESTE